MGFLRKIRFYAKRYRAFGISVFKFLCLVLAGTLSVALFFIMFGLPFCVFYHIFNFPDADYKEVQDCRLMENGCRVARDDGYRYGFDIFYVMVLSRVSAKDCLKDGIPSVTPSCAVDRYLRDNLYTHVPFPVVRPLPYASGEHAFFSDKDLHYGYAHIASVYTYQFGTELQEGFSHEGLEAYYGGSVYCYVYEIHIRSPYRDELSDKNLCAPAVQAGMAAYLGKYFGVNFCKHPYPEGMPIYSPRMDMDAFRRCGICVSVEKPVLEDVAPLFYDILCEGPSMDYGPMFDTWFGLDRKYDAIW